MPAGTKKNVYVVSSAARVELFVNGVEAGHRRTEQQVPLRSRRWPGSRVLCRQLVTMWMGSK